MNGGIEESADEGVRAGQARIGLPAGQVSDDLSDAGVATPEQSEDLNAQSVPAPGAGHLTRAQVDGVVDCRGWKTWLARLRDGDSSAGRREPAP